MTRRAPHQRTIDRWRYLSVAVVLGLLPVVALWHTAGLQVFETGDKGARFLQLQGDARTLRIRPVPAYRGVITDRHGEPLAVSTAVVTLWANPKELLESGKSLEPLARRLGVPLAKLRETLDRNAKREFMFLARRLAPADANPVLELKLKGVYGRDEYKRYYPAGEVAAQLVGFTDIDDKGQEGLELAYDQWLAGVPGERRVLQDRNTQVIKDLELIRSEKPGNDLALSIDLRLQYLAYRELRAALEEHRAATGSVVMLDAHTGEVLAMVSQPSFNPNARGAGEINAQRNRPITDMIEPGSVMKPFTMVAALESGRFRPDTPVDTAPGYIRFGDKTYKDPHSYGLLDLTGVLAKSSQVGTTKVAMTLDAESIRNVFDRVGIGQSPGTGFPGEGPGDLPSRRKWAAVEHASLAFGYGLTVTPLQLAGAYLVLANGGVRRPVTLLRQEPGTPLPAGKRVIEAKIADEIRVMLKAVVERGTGTHAAIPVYASAGKTGTSHKVGVGGYQAHHYVSLFAGMAPADNPQLVTVVVVDDPQVGGYFGGVVAAPVFARVTSAALRLLEVQPPLPPEPQRGAVADVTAIAAGRTGAGAG
ncbi:MAG: penicillin-binding transpeptidase domain-containing protein [Porticoccaceae bacterium]